MRTAQEIATDLGGARKDGNGWKCRCPVHDDHHGSLHISQAEDGGFLAHCFAGCDDRLVWQTIRDRLGLNGERLSSPSPRRDTSPQRAYLPPREPDPVDLRLSGNLPSADWRYRSASGVLMLVVARYDRDGRKTIRPWRWDGAKWVSGSIEAPRPLYGLPELSRRPDDPVMLVEGEKTADAARKLFPGHVCMTWPGGADGVRHVDFGPLKGRRVLLLPDADDPGRRAMGDAAARLKTVAGSVTLIDPPEDVPQGWDVADADWTAEQAAEWLRVRIRGDRPAPMDWSGLAQRDPPAREWMIDGWLGRGHPTLFVGAGGIGKSLLSQQLGACLAIGEPFLAGVLRPLRVLIWACEDDHDELWRRQVAISQWLRRPLSDFANLIIVPRLGLDNTILTTEYGRPMWTPLVEELRQQCADYEADVWMGDNVGQMFGANENVRHDVTMFINGIAGACGEATPVLLGHPSRGQGSEFSGSSAWENAVRMRWWFGDRLPDEKREADPEEVRDESARFLCKRKTNYSVKDYLQFAWQDGVFVPHTDPGGVDDPYREAQAKRLIVNGIERLASMDIYGSEKPCSTYLPTLLLKYQLNDGIPAGVLGRAMRALMLDGKIARKEVGKNAARMARYGLVVC